MWCLRILYSVTLNVHMLQDQLSHVCITVKNSYLCTCTTGYELHKHKNLSCSIVRWLSTVFTEDLTCHNSHSALQRNYLKYPYGVRSNSLHTTQIHAVVYVMTILFLYVILKLLQKSKKIGEESF